MRVPLTIAVLVSASAATPAQADDQARERALELFAQSAEHYREGRFSVAVELLREAYDTHPEPTLLYNLARALEGLGELDEAIATYERFLRDAEEVEDRGAIERRLETLRRQRDDRVALDAARAGERDDPEPREEAQDVPAGGATGPPSSGNALPWVIAGVGLVAVGAGVFAGAMAKGRNDDALEEPVHELAVAFRDDAETLQLVANVALVGGALITTAGVLWVFADWPGGDEDTVRVSLGPGHAGIAGRF